MRVTFLLLFSVIFVSAVFADLYPGREITGVDFRADLISAGREITGVDFQANLISAGREITGVDFTATCTDPKNAQKLDLAVIDIRTPARIDLDRPVEIQVLMKNETSVECRECVVFLKSEDGYVDKAGVSFGPKASQKTTFTWTPKQEGRQMLTASLECPEDSNPKNNELSQRIEVFKKQIESDSQNVTDPKQTNKNKMKEKLNKEGLIEEER
jgi:hypothetical protein